MKRIGLFGFALLFLVVATLQAQTTDGEETSEDFPRVVIDPTLLEEEAYAEEISAAWMGYAFARLNWVMPYFSSEELGGEHYQRSFEEELKARETLARIWEELKINTPELEDPYLNDLQLIRASGFLPEYVWIYFSQETWSDPAQDLRLEEFQAWQAKNLPDHVAQTRAGIRL